METTKMFTRALCMALVLALVATTATAHIETSSDVRTLRVGGYNAFIDPEPSPLYANTVLSISTMLIDRETGSYATKLRDVTIEMSRDGFVEIVELHSDGLGYYVGSVLLPEPGNHTGTLRIVHEDEEHVGVTWFDVYPELDLRIRPLDAMQDVVAGRVTTMRVETLKPGETDAKPLLDDLRMRIEHWSDDHKTLIHATDIDMTQSTPGVWAAPHLFPDRGMYHLFFSSTSGGFGYGDVPMLHLDAIEPFDEPARETPAAGAVFLVLGSVIGALLFVRGRSARP